MTKKKNSCLTEALLETADDMRCVGISCERVLSAMPIARSSSPRNGCIVDNWCFSRAI
jgi:hypothetical protein